MLLIILPLVFFAWLFFFAKKTLQYWDDRQVPNKKSIASILGRSQAQCHALYYEYPNERYVGMYTYLKNALVIRDPDLIKEITIKSFDSFPDHSTFASKTADPLWNKNLFAIRGQDGWRDARTTLSPSFTTNKLKMMFALMQNCADEFTKHVEKQGNPASLEVKSTFLRLSVDVIATTLFGVTFNTFGGHKSQFFAMGKEAFNFRGIRGLKIAAFAFFPNLMRLLGISVFSRKAGDFFRGLIKETIQLREVNQIVRPDMIHLLLEARKWGLKYEQTGGVNEGFAAVQESEIGRAQKGHKVDLTDEDITGLALGVLFAGFHTTSTTLSFLSYELALAPTIQERLYDEIKGAPTDDQEKITYETLIKMKYLDMVVAEALRKWPPVTITNRETTKAVTIEPKQPHEKPLHLEPNTICFIPIFCIHKDAEHYPQPEKFDPERFNDENKHNLKPFTYIPFGAGPRNCVGSRYALIQIKLLLVETLRKFEFVPVEKTNIPDGGASSTSDVLLKEGLWVGFKPRSVS